jgi:SsrA-binding protein
VIYAENAKVRFDYTILDEYEAGIELLGHEVKSIKKGGVHLVGSHVIIRGGEVYVVGMKIDPFQKANTSPVYDPLMTRRLLLHKKEIVQLLRDVETTGNTIVPINLYANGRRVKMKIALVKGKKLHDKRETIKKRDNDRDLRREYKVR